MKKVVSGLIFASVLTSASFASQPTTFVGPTLHGGYTSTITDSTAFSLAGEAGARNFRAGATYAFKICDDQRAKISAEYLLQDLKYSFYTGTRDEWVSQTAVGGRYEYLLSPEDIFQPQINIGGYASYSPNKSLSTIIDSYLSPIGGNVIFVDERKIVGAVAFGFNPGFGVKPWPGGTIEVIANYDHVAYRTDVQPSHDAFGFGGTVNFSQELTPALTLNLSAALRKPFNNYAGSFNWTNFAYGGNWMLGIFGGYTNGKNALPSSYNAGVSINYLFDCLNKRITIPQQHHDLKGEYHDYKGETAEPNPLYTDDFVRWAAMPAVYMPQVLAAAQDQITLNCTTGAPVNVSSIPSITTPIIVPTTIQTAAAFRPTQGLVYSLASVTKSDPSDTSTVIINPFSGAVTVTPSFNAEDIITISVAATNSCGVATTAFSVAVPGLL